jgi:hypothetical protein
MNKYIRSTGLYAFLFPASLKAPGQTAAEKIEQLKPEFIHRERRLEIYLELFIVFHCRCSAVMDNEIFI